jgi:hypothetical protein
MSDNINPGVIVGTKLILNTLTDQELAALYSVVTANSNPKPVMGYDKAKSLFTEQNGTKMHSDTLAAFESIVEQRLFSK